MLILPNITDEIYQHKIFFSGKLQKKNIKLMQGYRKQLFCKKKEGKILRLNITHGILWNIESKRRACLTNSLGVKK